MIALHYMLLCGNGLGSSVTTCNQWRPCPWRLVATCGGHWQLANDSGFDQQRRRSKAAEGFEPGPVSKEACEDATAQLVP